MFFSFCDLYSVFRILTASKKKINYQNNGIFCLVLLVVEMFRNIDFQMRYDKFTANFFMFYMYGARVWNVEGMDGKLGQ